METADAAEIDNRALLQAVKDDDLPRFTQLLSLPTISVNFRDGDNYNVMAWAAMEGRLEMIQLLLSREDAEVNQTDDYGYTPLMLAAKRGFSAVVNELLLDDMIDVNLRAKNGSHALSLAARYGHLEVVRLLADHNKCNILLKNNDGQTAEDEAAAMGQRVVVELLQEKTKATEAAIIGRTFVADADTGDVELLRAHLQNPKLDVNFADENGYTALDIASRTGHVEVVRLLLRQKAIQVNTCDEHGGSPLIWCVHHRRNELQRMVMQHPACDVNYVTKHGHTALILAARAGNVEGIRILMEHADLDFNKEAGGDGWTALSSAAANKQTEAVKLLLSNSKTNINATSKFGVAALHDACRLGATDIVRFMLAHKDIDPNILEQDKTTPLINAATSGFTDVVQLLVDDARVNVNLKDRFYSTALIRAAERDRTDVIEVLVTRTDLDYKIHSKTGKTALALATKRANGKAISLMRAKMGISESKVFDRNRTLLQAVSMNNAPRVTELLAAGGLSINSQDEFGYTALHIACYNGFTEVATALLQQPDINVNIVDNYDEHVLIDAARGGHVKIVERLLEKPDINVNAKNGYHYTALMFAASNGYASVMRLLLDRPEIEVNVQENERGYSPLIWAAVNNCVDGVRLLAEHPGVDFYILEETGMNALDLAYDYGRTKVVQILRAKMKDYDDSKVEQNVNNYQSLVSASLGRGMKPWGRSKLMIVGEGRAGKTAFANTILGKDFSHTESTLGIDQMTCEVKYTTAGTGGWNQCDKPEKEFESALAEMVVKADLQRAQKRSKFVKSKDVFITDGKEGGADKNEDEENAKVGAVAAQVGDSSATKNHGTEGNVDPDGAGCSNEDAKKSQKRQYKPKCKLDQSLVDNEFLMRCLSDKAKLYGSDVSLSVFDFGGQSVFNVIHHFFLTKQGVYALVFNMTWLVGGAANPRYVECLQTMRFWLNSIIVHTSERTDKGFVVAPIVIVGTRKDEVASKVVHQEISSILANAFGSSLAWPFILEDAGGEGEFGTVKLNFFPIDNTLGGSDATVVRLRKVVERTIESSEHVHLEKPLTWFRLMDKLQESKKTILSLEELKVLAAACEVDQEEELTELLLFLHEMGVLMWFDEEHLRNVVILDAIKYFVAPVTTIICKHDTGDGFDKTRHVQPVHDLCMKQRNKEWKQFLRCGMASGPLLHLLLSNYVEARINLVRLMVKFGLIVPLLLENASYDAKEDADTAPKSVAVEFHGKYIVPALLPFTPTSLLSDWTQERSFSTCFFMFTSSDDFAHAATITMDELMLEGFLPQGLFEKLVCRAVNWCQETSLAKSMFTDSIYRDTVVLSFGNQRFRAMLCRHDDGLPVIRLDVEIGNPLAVFNRLLEQIQTIIHESMRALKCVPAVCFPYTSQAADLLMLEASGSTSNANLRRNDILFTPISHVRDLTKSHRALLGKGGRSLLGTSAVRDTFQSWIHDTKLKTQYDFFISYRWGDADSGFVAKLFDCFTNFNIGENCRAVSVFLDTVRLVEGRPLSADFGRALLNSNVVVPILSKPALIRMRDASQKSLDHRPDNVLVEWLLATECFGKPQCKVERVYPIAFGDQSEFEGITDLFSDGILDDLPDFVPTATIANALSILQSHQIDPSAQFQTLTVRQIVRKLSGFLLFKASDAEQVVQESAKHCIDILRGCEQVHTMSTPRLPIMLVEEARAPTQNAPSPSKEVGLMSIIDRLREELRIDARLPAEVLQQAMQSVAMSEQDAGFVAQQTFKDKAKYVADCIGIQF